jgi:lipoprotein-anchoring transpeptidase ErfK/SrfK
MSFRRPRRFLQACLASLLLGLAAGLWVAPDRSAAQSEALYFAATGHRLTNDYGFLGHWGASNGPLTLGPPITEPLVEGGLTVQYFERGRLGLHPEYGGAVLRGRLGAEYAEALWRSFAPPAAMDAEQAGARLFVETGHAVSGPLLSFWEANGGLEVFGLPLSAPAWEYVGARVAQVQYFERARLEHYAGADPAAAVQIGALGRDLALLRGLPTAPVDPAGALVVDNNGLPLPEPATPPPTTAPPPTAAPAPTKAPAAPAAAAPAAAQPKPQPKPAAQAAPVASGSGGKSIIVDLSDQWLYALEGDAIIFDAPVSTGRDGFNTPVGRFAIYHKTRSQTMRGCAGGECWSVPDVPHAMYIVGGVALHGTYWHNQFGSGVRRSHGCVNLPLKSAAWLYGWASLGTPVTVRW